MGRGQKRGRTQRRHFKQSGENVWKLNPKKTRPDADEPDADAKADANPKWEPFATQNPGFDEYYKVLLLSALPRIDSWFGVDLF